MGGRRRRDQCCYVLIPDPYMCGALPRGLVLYLCRYRRFRPPTTAYFCDGTRTEMKMREVAELIRRRALEGGATYVVGLRNTYALAFIPRSYSGRLPRGASLTSSPSLYMVLDICPSREDAILSVLRDACACWGGGHG